jgi:hypothetical protein
MKDGRIEGSAVGSRDRGEGRSSNVLFFCLAKPFTFGGGPVTGLKQEKRARKKCGPLGRWVVVTPGSGQVEDYY